MEKQYERMGNKMFSWYKSSNVIYHEVIYLHSEVDMQRKVNIWLTSKTTNVKCESNRNTSLISSVRFFLFWHASTWDLIAAGPLECSALGMVLSSGATFLTKGCSKSWAAVGRCSGLRCKHSLIKLFPSSDRWSGISGSSLLFPILNMAATFESHKTRRIRSLRNICHAVNEKCITSECCIIPKCLNSILLTPSYWLQGGFVVAISRTVQPRLHISTARLQPFEFLITWSTWAGNVTIKPYEKSDASAEKGTVLTSGAIQYGLPLNDNGQDCPVIYKSFQMRLITTLRFMVYRKKEMLHNLDQFINCPISVFLLARFTLITHWLKGPCSLLTTRFHANQTIKRNDWKIIEIETANEPSYMLSHPKIR